MNDIKIAIDILAKHNYRTTSAVVGEYIELLVKTALDGKSAKHCQKGFDLTSNKLGKVEVKSRNSESKTYRCTLNESKLASLDNFILVIVNGGDVEQALLFNKKVLNSMRQSISGKVYVNKSDWSKAKDITDLVRKSM